MDTILEPNKNPRIILRETIIPGNKEIDPSKKKYPRKKTSSSPSIAIDELPKSNELPKDKMPVGKGERVEDFKLNEIEIQKGDFIYLYTDGYADQFGGPKGKKYKYKQLNDHLLSISHLPVEEQSLALKSKFDEWKGKLEQVDDVCLIGIKF